MFMRIVGVLWPAAVPCNGAAPAMPATSAGGEHEFDYDIGMFAQSLDATNPLVLFGFDPQPEPPAYFGVLDGSGAPVSLNTVMPQVSLPPGIVPGAGALACPGALRRRGQPTVPSKAPR